MCDIQAITGISILTGGFICLDERLSAHHWDMIVNLAWFSSITHLAGLTVLRNYLKIHHSERNSRIFFMFLLLVMLIVAMVPTAFFDWRFSDERGTTRHTAALLNTPAICLFSLQCGKALHSQVTDEISFAKSNGFQEMMISVFFLITGFLTRTIKLSVRLSNSIYRRISNPVNKVLEGLFRKLDGNFVSGDDSLSRRQLLSLLWHEYVTRPTLAIVIVTRTQITLFNSMLAEVRRLELPSSQYFHSTPANKTSIAVLRWMEMQWHRLLDVLGRSASQ